MPHVSLTQQHQALNRWSI